MQYTLLLKQHIGQPAVPVVREGDRVCRGQLIAAADGLGADLHASVSGTVSAVDGDKIVLAADEIQPESFEPVTGETVLDKIRAAGIVGMGGAGFPTWAKLQSAAPGGVVIANAAECEPILRHNIARIEEDSASLCRGLGYAMQACGARRGVIAVKEHHHKAVAALKAAIQGSDISLHLLADMYPMGEERAVVREVLGVLLGPDELPSKAGAVVLNTETLQRVAEAVEQGRPVTGKNLTVAGRLKSGAASVVLQDVPLGTRVADVLDMAGGLDGDYGEIIMGGPFTGCRVTPEDVVTKTTGGLIVTMPFLRETRPLGLLVCACGATEARMREIANKMNAAVVAVDRCKQAQEVRGTLKCQNPGNCPGQAQPVLGLKKAGAQALLIGNCSDCSNTVMSVAPKLGLPVYHVTDGALRAMNQRLIRRLK